MSAIGRLRITRQGVAIFVGIILLGAAVTYGAGFLQERGEQVRREQAVRQAEEALAKQTEEAVEVAADTDEQNSPEEVPVTGNSDTLPHTGAGDLYPIMVVVALTVAGSYYVSSRRAVKTLDLSV